jgi:CRISPR type I-E-associated protein CasB/Cse2
MSAALEFVRHLEALQEGERSRLRSLAGKPLDESVAGFDLFTGLWWPLRERRPDAPRREPSWLVAKLHASFEIRHVDGGPRLPAVLGVREPPEAGGGASRERFDALLQAPSALLEPRLRWALGVVEAAVEAKATSGLDWARLLDDLSIWDRGRAHRLGRDIREIWAEEYLGEARAC